MLTNFSQKIANIIQKRKPLVQKIEVVQNNLQKISAALQSLEKARHEVMKIADPQIQGRLKDIDFSSVQGRITDERGTLRKLKRRFSRDTLNIGVIGRARQGKSRLLQTLSGLTATQIPDGSGGHCTGVRSTIYHNPNVPPYADVWFYSERAFLDEVITPYYHDLGLGAPPQTTSDFKNNPLATLPPDKQKLAQDRAKYSHLQRYQNKLSEYDDLLRTNSPRRIEHDQIREYVAQDTPDGKRKFFNFLAVREVRIVCSFPLAQVGKIALIDMPGLGDTGVGAQEGLVKTLEEDVDIILFVKRPDPLGAIWSDVDIQLYDVAQRALNKIPLERWSFMVLNRVGAGPHSNAQNCHFLKRKLQTTSIKVAQCIITDCSMSLLVNNNLLNKLLHYMSANITDLDEEYAKTGQESLDILHNEVNAMLAKARDVLRVPLLDDDFNLFRTLFEQVFGLMTTSLEDFKRELQENRDIPDVTFLEYIEKALTACKSISLPSLQEINKMRDMKGRYPYAYYEYLDIFRTRMISYLSSLDDALKISVTSTKSQVANVLIQNGRLGELTSDRGTDFLKSIYGQIPDECAQVKYAFKDLYSFEIRFRGFLLYRIRQQIKWLEPDYAPSMGKEPDGGYSAEQVRALLETARDETAWKLESIREWVGDVNLVAFALVEEFVDQAIRAEKVKREWERFYRIMRSDIWPKEFKKFGTDARLRKEWETGIERVSKANQANSVRLLN